MVSVGKYFMLSEFYLGMICFAAVLGHIYPIFYNFKGGKGVAVFIGVTAGISSSHSTIILFNLVDNRQIHQIFLIVRSLSHYPFDTNHPY